MDRSKYTEGTVILGALNRAMVFQNGQRVMAPETKSTEDQLQAILKRATAGVDALKVLLK